MADYYEYSIPELVQLLGGRFKDYRMRSRLTQKEVAEQAGIDTERSGGASGDYGEHNP